MIVDIEQFRDAVTGEWVVCLVSDDRPTVTWYEGDYQAQDEVDRRIGELALLGMIEAAL